MQSAAQGQSKLIPTRQQSTSVAQHDLYIVQNNERRHSTGGYDGTPYGWGYWFNSGDHVHRLLWLIYVLAYFPRNVGTPLPGPPV